jgi:hypothetical protein
VLVCYTPSNNARYQCHIEGGFGGGEVCSFTYLNLFRQNKSSKGIRTNHLGVRKQSEKQKDPQRACVRGVGVMPVIWVINPLCMSRGWGLIRTVIMWDMNGTSCVVMKGVVRYKSEQNSSCSFASRYSHFSQL